ncbi:MAG: class I SAM-dependent methyltransferase [Gammaproteobacteria bacterium]
MNIENLPKPDSNAQAHSEKLQQYIIQMIEASEGFLSFQDFMQAALYAPGLGYYMSGAHKIGKGGDFITAPELSPLFSKCVAKYCCNELTRLNGGNILEFGAGTGTMAAHILETLALSEVMPEYYYILEPSPDLQTRQKATINNICPEQLDRVQWLSSLPEAFEGIILANEVVDAMPVVLFEVKDRAVFEKGVGVEDNRFVWKTRQADETLTERVESLVHESTYTSEINFFADEWIKSIANILRRGSMLIIDYGFSNKEYYHPQRCMGTLMCHYQHHAHDDPLILVGIQDITAHVDFSSLTKSAEASGLNVHAYSNQVEFLLAHDLLIFAEALMTTPEWHTHHAHAIKQLTSPGEMGELFKVLCLRSAG